MPARWLAHDRSLQWAMPRTVQGEYPARDAD